jgi:hypothetical protein
MRLSATLLIYLTNAFEPLQNCSCAQIRVDIGLATEEQWDIIQAAELEKIVLMAQKLGYDLNPLCPDPNFPTAITELTVMASEDARSVSGTAGATVYESRERGSSATLAASPLAANNHESRQQEPQPLLAAAGVALAGPEADEDPPAFDLNDPRVHEWVQQPREVHEAFVANYPLLMQAQEQRMDLLRQQIAELEQAIEQGQEAVRFAREQRDAAAAAVAVAAEAEAALAAHLEQRRAVGWPWPNCPIL